jgi:hypothetical protein
MIFSGGIVFVVRSDAWVDINNELEIRKIVLLYFINKLSLLVPRIDLADTSLESTDLNNASRAVTLRLFQASTVGERRGWSIIEAAERGVVQGGSSGSTDMTHAIRAIDSVVAVLGRPLSVSTGGVSNLEGFHHAPGGH